MDAPSTPAPPPSTSPATADARATPPPDMRILAACFLVGLVGAIVLAQWLVGTKPGNRLVVVNAGAVALDSIAVDPEPAGANWFLRRYGAVAARDSAWFHMPPGGGDADIKVWRGGHVVADHAVQFGGNTIFEIRVGDAAQAGRYRRLGR